MPNITSRFAYWLVLVCLLWGAVAHSAERTTVDQLLLDGLDADLIDSNDDRSAAAPERVQGDRPGEDSAAVVRERENELTQVVQHMQTAQRRLQQRPPAGKASASQGEALRGLDAMIAKYTQKQARNQSEQREQRATNSSENDQDSGGNAGNSPAPNSANSTVGDNSMTGVLGRAGVLVKDLWGTLPERQRQQILQPLSEEYLPAYADDIEAYFRALAQPEAAPAAIP